MMPFMSILEIASEATYRAFCSQPKRVLLLVHGDLDPPASGSPTWHWDAVQSLYFMGLVEQVAARFADHLALARLSALALPEVANQFCGPVAPGYAAAILPADPTHHWLEPELGYTAHDIRTWLWPCLRRAPSGPRDVLLLAAYELVHEEDYLIRDGNGWLWDTPTVRAAAIAQVARSFAQLRRAYPPVKLPGGERMKERLALSAARDPRPVPHVDLDAWAKARDNG
jgi:hypothetical protein